MLGQLGFEMGYLFGLIIELKRELVMMHVNA